MPEVLLACARPADVPPQDWDELTAMLDEDEHDRARRLRFEVDRHAFVLAHALLRALVGAESGLPADGIRIAHDIKGRPFVASSPAIHVSLSRTRDAVACAATRIAPVGVDVEVIDGKPVDAGLLGAFVVTHEAITAEQFFRHWTALEAFWKSCGTGLADGQPRICCIPRSASRFDVQVERGLSDCVGRGAIVDAFPDCAVAVVLCAPIEPRFVVKRTHCASALDIRQLSRARAPHDNFCAA
jgi:4'-phosphopantetheinyl transferase